MPTRTISQTIDLTNKPLNKYITEITGGGIKVHDSDDVLNYIQLTSDGMEVFKTDGAESNPSAVSVAKFGSTARIGKTNEAHIEQTSTGLNFVDSSGVTQASMTANNGTFVLEDVVSAHKIELGSGMTIANGGALEASFDSSGATIYEQGDPLVKMYRNNDGYGALAIGSTEYASGQMDVNVEGYTGANYSLGQLVTLRSNGTEQHFAQFLGYGQDGQGSMALITAQGHNKTKAEIELDSQSANSNIKLDASTTSITGNVEAAGYVRDTIISATPTITRTSGGTILVTAYKRSGHVATLRIQFSSSGAVAGGVNIFEGTLPSGYRPLITINGCGYYGKSAVIGQIAANGELIIRNASSTSNTFTNAAITFTYIID